MNSQVHGGDHFVNVSPSEVTFALCFSDVFRRTGEQEAPTKQHSRRLFRFPWSLPAPRSTPLSSGPDLIEAITRFIEQWNRQRRGLALAPQISAAEIAEIKSARWQQALDAALNDAGKSLADAESAPKDAGWKVAISRNLRTSVAAPDRWIATTLKMGHPAAVRGDL